MNSFDSEQYLKDYSDFGLFPQIHRNIVEYILSHSSKTDSILDLCCCTGLLGEQLKSMGYVVYGIEGNINYVELSKKYNVLLDILSVMVTKNSIVTICDFIKKNKIKTLISRRCFPELFGNDFDFGKLFLKEISLVGISTIFIEGRIYSSRSTNKLSSIDKEIDLCKDSFSLYERNKNIAILKVK